MKQDNTLVTLERKAASLNEDSKEFLAMVDQSESNKMDDTLATQKEAIEKAQKEADALHDKIISESRKFLLEADEKISERVLAAYASYLVDIE